MQEGVRAAEQLDLLCNLCQSGVDLFVGYTVRRLDGEASHLK